MASWIKHDATSKSAALAFYTLFSLAPILVLVVSIAGYFVGATRAQGAVVHQLHLVLGAAFSDGIKQLLQAAIASGDASRANVIATVLLIVGSTSVFSELKDSLDAIWEAPPAPGSGLWLLLRTRLLSFGLLLAVAFLLLVSLLVNVALDAFEHVWSRWWPAAMGTAKPISWLVSLVVVTLLFALIFKFLPQKHLRWRDVAVRALTSAVLFALGRIVITLYLSHGGLATVYGAAGSAVVLTTWVYYSALVYFLGAQFTRQYVQIFGGDSQQPRDADVAPSGRRLDPTATSGSQPQWVAQRSPSRPPRAALAPRAGRKRS